MTRYSRTCYEKKRPVDCRQTIQLDPVYSAAWVAGRTQGTHLCEFDTSIPWPRLVAADSLSGMANPNRSPLGQLVFALVPKKVK